MRKGLWMVLLMLSYTGAVQAGSRSDMRKQIEMSMPVTGTIDLDAAGGVSGYTLDRPEALPKSVVTLVGNTVSTWRFEPVVIDGKARNVRTPMRLLLGARQLESGNYGVQVRDASFGNQKNPDLPKGRQMSPPEYPADAEYAGVQGTVFLVIRIDRNGEPAQIAVQQVNMRTLAPARDMERNRKWLADASLAAARRWRFDPPRTGDQAKAPFWDVRVPMVYLLFGRNEAKYGQWEAYLPGPRNLIPWLGDAVVSSSDTLVPGGVYPLQAQGPHLLTSLTGD